jgi:hypothetical protein
MVMFDFNQNNLWEEMTKDIQSKEDWDRLSNDHWDKLVEFQYIEDEDFFNEQFGKQTLLDPEFTKFVDSLAPEEVLEFKPEEI